MDFEHLTYVVLRLTFKIIAQLYVQQIVLHTVYGVDAVLLVFPSDTDAKVGSDVRLNCTTSLSKPVSWQYGKDPAGMADVYIGGEGLVRPYSNSKRYSVDEDPTTGRYDLLIKDVSKEDEGVYVCSEKASRDDPPQARLTVTGAQRPDCQIYEIFMVGAEAKLNFTTCTCRPFYVDHVPIGKSHADDLYNNGKLLNDYAKSGRFRIEDAGESCALSIANVKTLDAGKYICRELSGLGGMHDKDIIVRGETCDNTSDTNNALQGNCTIRFVGHRDPLLTWMELHCNGSQCRVGNASNSNPQTCTLQNPTLENMVQLQCQFAYENDHDGNADSLPENHTWNVLLLVGCVGALAVVLIGLISVIVWCKKVWDRNNTPSAGNDTHGGTNVPLRHSVHDDGQEYDDLKSTGMTKTSVT